MPQKARIKHANQHDKRHDAGLAAPGKRIARDKDRLPSPITGSPVYANGRPLQSHTPPLQLASTASSSVSASPRPDFRATDSDESASAGEKLAVNGHPGKDLEEEVVNMEHEPSPLHPVVVERETSTLKNLASQAGSTVTLAATILRACPLRDAVAILILLLSLPASMIIVIHGLFASLTFVPPAAGFSWGPWTLLPSFSDWFHATPGGGPSLFTILFSDLVMAVMHLASPLKFQSIFMDLAHAVIALSLSGAAAGTDSSTTNVAFCSVIILVFHLARYKDLHIAVMQYLSSSLRMFGFELGYIPLLGPESPSSNSIVAEWVRLLLGCHILAQGLLTLLRRWFAGANQKAQGSKLDAEQAALLNSGKLAMLNLAAPDSVPTAVPDSRSSAPALLAREGKEKASNRKRRKQLNQARVQQPLWAALASTKITYMKEMEQKYLTEDRREVAASATTTQDSEPDSDRFWIVDIGPTSINFRTELSKDTRKAKCSSSDNKPTPGVDKDKPFFVRLNGADWGSTRIVKANADDNTCDEHCRNWSGEIYGLSPLTKYLCEFVGMSDHHVRFTTNLITMPAPNAEQVVAVPTPAPPSSLRPMSPTSTLKQSINVAEVKREEVRNRLKRLRKDHKSSATSARRDIEQLQSKVASSGGQDERSRQRILQLKQHVKQAEDSIEALKAELETLGEVPEEDVALATTHRKSYDAAMEDKDAAKTDLDNARTEAHKELAALQAEISSIRQKHDRLDSRRARVTEMKDKLVSEQNAGNARQSQRAQALDERVKMIDQLTYLITVSRREGADYALRAAELFQQVQQNELPPPTPEGDLPGTRPFGPLGAPPSLQHWGQRPGFRQRSSSMLSGYSGFTDEWEGTAGQAHNGFNEQGSSGSEGSEAQQGGWASASPGPGM